MAKHNAPSVIFVDDSDVIFEAGQEQGLYRYLWSCMSTALPGPPRGRRLIRPRRRGPV
jgi:hypothetical protein